ncbi:hypothetical protein [Pseudoxanthomonas suwonensis]|nr:hypothetical protein [Pseudoxanthomonas suwonensis]
MNTLTGSAGCRSATALLLSAMAILGLPCLQLPVHAQTIDAGG